MSYALTPSRFLRHLAIAYRKQNRNQGKDFVTEQERMPALSEKEVSLLKNQLQLLEKKYAELLLDKELDEETMQRISSKIRDLKEKL